MPNTAFKKKLYKLRPGAESNVPKFTITSRETFTRTKIRQGDPASLEREVRQILADKVSGHLCGGWLLVAEHLRLGTWDLLCGWAGYPTERVEPRLALQLVHEAAICAKGLRAGRTMSNRGGFELTNGLPFIATDTSIHELLNEHTVAEAIKVQVALGKIRRASGCFQANVLAIDPHRVQSYSKRRMRKHAAKPEKRRVKVAQTFWLLDTDTNQPICFTTGTAARTVTEATPELLDIATEILAPQDTAYHVMADMEHYSAEIFDDVIPRPHFELMVPMANTQSLRKQMAMIPESDFTPRWAGFATLKREYELKRGQLGPCYQFAQRSGEIKNDWRFKAYLSTSNNDEVQALCDEYPKRWHVEEFFNFDQSLGWDRAGTMNLNIRYGGWTMALIAQAAVHGIRKRLGAPYNTWNATHMAKEVFQGLDGDVRVKGDTIVVTYYNAPNVEILRGHYQNLPAKLECEGVDPRIPWLYGFKLDFCFR